MAGTTQGNILSTSLFNPIPIGTTSRPQDELDFHVRLWGVPPLAGCTPTVYELLETIASGSGGGGGSATAANQVIEIGHLNNIYTQNTNDIIPALSIISNATVNSDNYLFSIDGKVATTAKQDTGNASLASIDTKQSSIVTALQEIVITGAANQTTIDRNIINAVFGNGATDTLGYESVILQIVPAAGTVTAGNIVFEGSNDNVNFTPILNAVNLAAMGSLFNASGYSVVAATNRYVYIPLTMRYLKARISVAITGTSTGVQCFSVFKMGNNINVNVPISGTAVTTMSDAVSNPALNQIWGFQSLFNGTTWDRWYNNSSQTALASASRAVGTTNTTITNYNGRGATYFINVSAFNAGGTLNVKIQEQDPVSGNWIDISGAAIAPIVATVTTVALRIYPGITTVANAAVSTTLPRNTRIVSTVTVDNVTYSIGFQSQM